MLKVKTYLKEIEGKGIGLFADQFIPEGTIVSVFEYPDIVIPLNKYLALDERSREFIYYYGWLEEGNVYISTDNDRFVNHSNNPNIIDKEEKAIALRDIFKDEEITCNYYELCDWVKVEGLGFEVIEKGS